MKIEKQKIQLDDLGYGPFFEVQVSKMDLSGRELARVSSEIRGGYRIVDAEGERFAKITGKQMFEARERKDYPAVGDWVVVEKIDTETTIIRDILKRKTVLHKKQNNREERQIIASNVDVAFIVEALDRDYNLNRLERYFILALEGGIEPVVILNKIDLITDRELSEKVEEIKTRLGNLKIFLTSVETKAGIEELRQFIARGKTYSFLGSSGVGKSSLINQLLEKDAIKTGTVGKGSNRGRHTTTVREMYFLKGGGLVIDNPGTREVGVVDADTGIENVFDEIVQLAQNCKYVDCSHLHEPDCAVIEAVEKGELSQEKYQNYLRIQKENQHYQMTKSQKRKKDKKFGKFVKSSLKRLDKYNW